MLYRAARDLVRDELLRKRKEGRKVRYWPVPEVLLAADSL